MSEEVDELSFQSLLDDMHSLYKESGNKANQADMFPISLMFAAISQRNLENISLFTQLRELVKSTEERKLVDNVVHNAEIINRAYMSVIENISRLMHKYSER